MKHKKHVTDAVLKANRDNSQLSTGPKTEKGKAQSSRNSFRHGILSRKMVFRNEKSRRRFLDLWESWKRQFHPHGRLERFLVEEIAIISWKLGITERLETQDLLRRQEGPSDISGIFDGELNLPLSSFELPLEHGLDCERFVVRAVAGNDSRSVNARRNPQMFQNQPVIGTQAAHSSHEQEGSQLEIHAVMGSSLHTMTRYRAALKRDLYHAIETLRSVQAERRENKKEKNWGDASY